MKKFIAVMLAAAFVFSSFAFASAESFDDERSAVGMRIAGFNTRDLYGNPVTSSILNNAVCTVINEWATWCDPCVHEMPYFQAMHEHYSATLEADVQIIGAVFLWETCTPESAKQFLESNGYTWQNLLEDNTLAQVFNQATSIPSTIIVDRNGFVREHRLGSFASSAQLQEFIDSWYAILLAEGIPGDINGNGIVEISDAVTVLRIAIGIANVENSEAGDINQNGAIDIGDAVLILRIAMGL